MPARKPIGAGPGSDPLATALRRRLLARKRLAHHTRFHRIAAELLANLLRGERRFSEAIAALKKAIELQSESAAAYNDLGLIYLEKLDVDAALHWFGQAIKLKPDFAIAHFNRGLALERQGNCREAIAAFRRVVDIDPSLAEAYAKVGNLLLAEGNRTEAAEYLRRGAEIRPGSFAALASEAKLLMEQDRAAAAEGLMRRAIDLHPRNNGAHCQLGSILMQLGRFHEAAASFDQAIAIDRCKVAAYYGLAQVKKLAEPDRPLIAQMERLLTQPTLSEDEQVDLHFALGKGYDDLGDYAKAIAHFDRGNGLRHRRVLFDRAQNALVVDRLIAKFTADFFARNRALGSDWDMPVLILGMPRSGTTLVEQIISSHPAAAAGGELPFWEESAASFRVDAHGCIDPAWTQRVADDYRKTLAGISATALRITDKKPSNFLFIGLVHSVFPRARIIHCRCHPVDTCLSVYFQNFARRVDFAYDRGDLLACCRGYLRLMEHWRSVLPADRLLEIQYEDLVTDHEMLTRKMIAFCGLDWDDACLHSNRNRCEVRTARVWQARQPVYRTSVERWQRYEPWLGELRELLSL